MNEFNDINKDLKDFVKHILEGKYDDEFIKIYRNSYYDKTSNDITLRESDILSPLCQKLIKTDMLLAILNFQGKITNGKIKIEDNTFKNFKNETLEKSIKLRNIAEASNKSIVIEKLDFSKKKEELKAGINQRRNVQLSSFSYAKIKTLIKARAGDAGIDVLEVNPAYTSVIGRAKYSKRLGISVHRAAAYAIARRGMNKKEKETVFQLNLAESERKMLEKHNGNAYWKKVQELIRANKKTLSQESQVV